MFTGLIESTGRLEAVETIAAGRRLVIRTPWAGTCAPGESISVNGVCLTVADHDDRTFAAVVSPETLRVTTIGHWKAGHPVNLERAMRADSRLGGHFVLGHVDGVGRIVEARDEADCRWIEIAMPAAVASSLVPKGSVAVDGISLTVARLEGERVGIQIVPHTAAETSAGAWQIGDAVNVEGDVLGKYVARLVEAHLPAAGSHS